MSELSAAAPLRILGEAHTEQFNCDSSGAQTIYKGAGLVIDANVDTIYVHTANGLTLVDGDKFVGIAAENHATASGDSESASVSLVEAYVEPTIVGFKSTVFTNADMGKAVGMSDTGTLIAYGAGVRNPASSGGAYPRIGFLHEVRDGYAFVRLESPFVIDVT